MYKCSYKGGNMQTILINSSELAQMQKLGRGACSTVYKYGADLVIKVLNEKENNFTSEELEFI